MNNCDRIFDFFVVPRYVENAVQMSTHLTAYKDSKLMSLKSYFMLCTVVDFDFRFDIKLIIPNSYNILGTEMSSEPAKGTNAGVPSEMRISKQWDFAFEQVVTKVSLGGLIAGLSSIVLFRK